MTSHTRFKLSLIANAFALTFALALTPASASGLPMAKLNALECASTASESCCERWVNVVMTAAKAESDTSSMLSVLPRRIDRWVIIEKRAYCEIKKDIEARAVAFGDKPR